MSRPMFAFWAGEGCLTIVAFQKMFQVKPIARELFSQRQDASRIRIFGLSLKLFG
jgi:hypothetical protein